MLKKEKKGVFNPSNQRSPQKGFKYGNQDLGNPGKPPTLTFGVLEETPH